MIALWILAGLLGYVVLIALLWCLLVTVVRRTGRRRAARRCLRCADVSAVQTGTAQCRP